MIAPVLEYELPKCLRRGSPISGPEALLDLCDDLLLLSVREDPSAFNETLPPPIWPPLLVFGPSSPPVPDRRLRELGVPAHSRHDPPAHLRELREDRFNSRAHFAVSAIMVGERRIVGGGGRRFEVVFFILGRLFVDI
jgi:hypothetical protein